MAPSASPLGTITVLLIFGFTIRFRHLADHELFCPACGGDRAGVLESGRRWFTLFFLPVIPLKELGVRVRCTTCGSSYDPSVLERPTTTSLATMMATATRAITAMVAAAASGDGREVRQAAVTSIRRVVPGYELGTLSEDIDALHPLHAADYAAPLAGALAPEGAERFLGDVVTVALAGGEITPDQRLIIDDVGRALELTPTHVIGIITAAAAAPAPTDDPS